MMVHHKLPNAFADMHGADRVSAGVDGAPTMFPDLYDRNDSVPAPQANVQDIDELVTLWRNGEWSARVLAGDDLVQSTGSDHIRIVMESQVDHRLFQQYTFEGGNVRYRELILYDGERGIEIRIQRPPQANQADNFNHAPLHRLAQLVLNSGIATPLGNGKIVGDRIAERVS